ncbi:MAG: hypothetical protein FJW37_13275 [Acidobacteria bacterium]|nr:hypothetical protein [Acidobacteriota bacterium]
MGDQPGHDGRAFLRRFYQEPSQGGGQGDPFRNRRTSELRRAAGGGRSGARPGRPHVLNGRKNSAPGALQAPCSS